MKLLAEFKLDMFSIIVNVEQFQYCWYVEYTIRSAVIISSHHQVSIIVLP
jgi:hypothetical protein